FPRSEFQKIKSERTMFPKLRRFRWQQRLSNVHRLAHKRFRLWTKRDINPALGAEQIRHHRIPATLDALKQQRGAAFVDHAAMDLCQLEIGIYLGFDGDDFVFPGKSIEECAQA